MLAGARERGVKPQVRPRYNQTNPLPPAFSLSWLMPLQLDPEQQRRTARRDLLMLLCIWLVIFAAVGAAILLQR